MFRMPGEVYTPKKAAAKTGGWQRPSDWPAMPATAANRVDILAAVFNTDGNYVAVNATVSSGNYTVDWGDGTITTNYTSAATASHQYTYSTLGTSLLSDGSKTATIKIYPTTGGANITAFDLSVKNSTSGLNGYSNPWLDIQINTPSCTSMSLRLNTLNCYLLQRVNIVAIGALTSLAAAFRTCYSLRSVTWPSGSLTQVTDISTCFYGCSALQSVTWPSGSLTQVTTNSGCFQNCYSLVSALWPAGSLALTTSIASCFQGCYSLQSITWPTQLSSGTATFTNGSSSIGWSGHPLIPGSPVQFTTTGSLPTNFAIATTYYVSTLGYSSSAFQVSSTASAALTGGAVISAGSAGSGTQTCAPTQPLSSVSSATTAFSSTYSLSNMSNCAIPVTFSVSSCQLSSADLNAIYTALPTVVGQTMTASLNYGYAGSTTSIATGKGWTVN